VIACFGQARLIRKRDGHFELRGGSRHERNEAYEWISMFMHEAVPRALVGRRICHGKQPAKQS
jgi:hypothetical protein